MSKFVKYSIVLFWILLVLLSLAGGYLVYYNTHIGPWAFSDSSVYIAAGTNWVKGGGMGFTQANGDFARLTHFPPGYPVLIGLANLVTASPVDAARWLNIVSFALLIFLGGWWIWRITSSRLFAIFFGVLILSSPFLLNPFSGIMSESPAILAGTLALLLLALYAKTGRKLDLVCAGLMAAAAVFIRYQQVAVLVSGALFLLLTLKTPWIARLKSLLIYALVSAGPFTAWLLVEALVFGRAARKISLMGDPGEITSVFLNEVFNSVKFWFPYRGGLIPGVDTALVRIILVIGFFAVLTIGLLHSRPLRKPLTGYSASTKLVLLSALYLVIYLLILYAADLFTSPQPVINNRMLSPMLPLLFIVILGLEYIAARGFGRWWWGASVMGITVILFCLTFLPQVKSTSIRMHGFGEGLTSSPFKDSSFVALLQQTSRERTLISNSVSTVLFFTQKEAFRPFEGPDDPAILTTKRFGDQDTRAQTVFREGCAALVIFEPSRFERLDKDSPWNFPAEAYGVTEGLVEIFTDPLGKIYLYPGCE